MHRVSSRGLRPGGEPGGKGGRFPLFSTINRSKAGWQSRRGDHGWVAGAAGGWDG